MRFRTRFFEPPAESLLLFGPRGTGKSTWCLNRFPGALRLDLLQPDVLRQYRARPERLREVVHQQPPGQTVVIDEIQKAPELLDVVHALIEEHRGWRFVLTGSSARKLKREGTDLLAGRAVRCALHPYMAAELGADFGLDRALQLGTLPVVVESGSPAKVLASYVSLYVREEVQIEGAVRKLGNFARFLEVASFSHSQVVNVSNIARECQVERTSVAGYLQILDDLLLAFRLPVFAKRAQRAVTVHPKFYYCDAGVFRSLRPAGPLDRPSEIDGAALEGLVAQHLRAWTAYSGDRCGLSFWRTRAGAEVDFVVYGDGGFWAIEVKNAGTFQRSDLQSLRSFTSEYPECRPVLLYRGHDSLVLDGVVCLPCERFLRDLVPGRPLLPG